MDDGLQATPFPPQYRSKALRTSPSTDTPPRPPFQTTSNCQNAIAVAIAVTIAMLSLTPLLPRSIGVLCVLRLTRRVLKVNGDAAVAALKAEEHLVGNRDKICAEDETEGGYMCKHTQSPTEEFANFSTLSAAFLSTSLLLSILVLAAGSSNTFAKEQETGGMAYQYRSVARAYLYWVRFVNLGTIFFTIFGTIFFVQSLKAMVYVKYTDSLVEVDGYSQAFGFYFKADSPYTFVNSATIWLCYVPITFSAIVLSVSTAMLNSYVHLHAMALLASSIQCVRPALFASRTLGFADRTRTGFAASPRHRAAQSPPDTRTLGHCFWLPTSDSRRTRRQT